MQYKYRTNLLRSLGTFEKPGFKDNIYSNTNRNTSANTNTNTNTNTGPTFSGA